MRRRILAALAGLATDPRPAGGRPLTGTPWPGVLEFRVGAYRALYVVEETAVRVLVVAVAHRREVYR